MVNVDEAFELRYKGFEVLVDFDKLNEFKANSDEVSVYDVLADPKIFKDQKKGELASETLLSESFNGKNEEEVLKEMLLQGECQIPTAFLNKMREEKKTQVINYISENAINPATKTKYTASMIETEVNSVRFNFDAQKDYMKQAEDVLHLIKKKIPISISFDTILMKIPAQYVGSFYGNFRAMGKVHKEFYDKYGNLNIEIEVNTTNVDRVIDYLKNNSNNEAEYRVVKE